jgi:hypothetical protein
LAQKVLHENLDDGPCPEPGAIVRISWKALKIELNALAPLGEFLTTDLLQTLFFQSWNYLELFLMLPKRNRRLMSRVTLAIKLDGPSAQGHGKEGTLGMV